MLLSQVGIGTSSPNSSAILDLTSTSKGLLIPRVQLTGRDDTGTIPTPATGLMVYNLSAANGGTNAVFSGFYFFDGTKWQRIISQQPDAAVEFNTADPNSGSPTFTPNVPSSSDYVYVSKADGKQWAWNGTSYVTYVAPSSTPWYLGGGVNDAAGNKTSTVYRTGSLGLGTTATIDNSAQLDVNSTSKGFLPPRMTKAQRDAIVSPATGLLVYCTNCSGTGGGCLVQNNGLPSAPSWECVGASSNSASVSAVCNGFVTGTYVNGTSVNGTYTVTITNNSLGAVTLAFASTDLVLSGVAGLSVGASVTVSPSGTSISPGASQVVTYTISGAPSSTGTLTGTWSKLTLGCSSTKTISNQLPTFSSSNAVVTANNYALTTSSSYSGTITIPYTVGVGGDAYPAQTIVSNGLTFTRNAGTYTASSGTITYTISGTYTGASGSSFTITTDAYAGGTSVIIFDAIRSALSQAGCSSCAAYDAAYQDYWVSITSTEYAQLASTVASASKYVASDGFMSQTPFSTYGTGFSATQGSSQSTVPANTYIYAFQYKPGGSATSIYTTGLKLKMSSSLTGSYSDIGPTMPSSSNSSSYVNYYFVLKRPSIGSTGGSAKYIGFYDGGSARVGTTTGGSNYAKIGDNSYFGVLVDASFSNTFIQVLATYTKQW